MDNAKVSKKYLPVKNIDFSSAKSKKKMLDNTINSANSSTSLERPINSSKAREANIAGAYELNSFYEQLSLSNTKPGVLSLISSNYVPTTLLPELPRPLSLLYDPNNLKLEYHELLEKCESISVNVTQNMASTVEKESRKQYKSRVSCRTNHCLKDEGSVSYRFCKSLSEFSEGNMLPRIFYFY